MTMLEESQTLDARVRERLEQVREQLFRPMGVDGVYARSALYEGLSERLDAFITRLRDPAAEVLRFPPVMSRRQLERPATSRAFPTCWDASARCTAPSSRSAPRPRRASRAETGPSRSARPTWCSRPPRAIRSIRWSRRAARCRSPERCSTSRPTAFGTSLRTSSAACSPFACASSCYIGVPEQVVGFRERWMQRGAQLARQLGLPTQIEVASDPFFGRVGQVMAVSQLQQALKFELLIPYHDAAPPTACMSFNYHREHFGDVWGFKSAAGEPIHTACVAFGMDRLVVAMFCVHGVELARWPDGVRRALAL